ncbi:hypothetical protein BKA60DRAFT_464238, partial [Fusarium oxysporum]
VASSSLGFLVYSSKTINLSIYPLANINLVNKSNIIYIDNISNSFILDNYIPLILNSFSKLYNTYKVFNYII